MIPERIQHNILVHINGSRTAWRSVSTCSVQAHFWMGMDAHVEPRKRCTMVSLRMQVGDLREENARLRSQLRKALRRSRHPQGTPKTLSRANARLRKSLRVSQKRTAALETALAEVGASRAVLSKSLYGRRSEQQAKPRSTRRRGQQPGVRGHGRKPRPALAERLEVHSPPAEACVCGGCGTPYVTNGERSTTIVEIDVQAHKRRIIRPRWRRACDCADSPREVTAPAPHRLFTHTPYGTTVWARVLFERYVCHRPLNGVARWLGQQGLPMAAGTLGNSVSRFVPLFESLGQAILDHQHQAAIRHVREATASQSCRRDQLENPVAETGGPLRPRLAVDLGHRGCGVLPHRSLAQRRGGGQAIRRDRSRYRSGLRPL